MLKLNGAEVGLGIDNNAAIVVDGDKWRIISDGGTATKKVFLNGEIHAEVLPPNGEATNECAGGASGLYSTAAVTFQWPRDCRVGTHEGAT